MPEMLPVQYVKFNTKRCFGIELEVIKSKTLDELVQVVRLTDSKHHVMGTNHYQQDSGNDYWHVKFDRSCGTKPQEGGWEVASYKASGAADLIKLANMGDTLKKNGAQVNDNCGYHIHVEIADFNTSQAATLMANWMKMERLLIEILPKGRRNNVYCRLLNDLKPVSAVQAKNVDTFWSKVRPLSLENSERRVSLNMGNYVHSGASKKTVELRLPEGTLDSKEIKNWARMFIHFANTCRTMPFPGNITPYQNLKEMLTGLGLHNEEPFFILSKGLYETKTWFLERIIKYGTNKVLRTETEKMLSFLIPPCPEDRVEETKSKLKEDVEKLKESLKKKRSLKKRTTPVKSDYWSAYEDNDY
jgi:hypothetical protein